MDLLVDWYESVVLVGKGFGTMGSLVDWYESVVLDVGLLVDWYESVVLADLSPQ